MNDKNDNLTDFGYEQVTFEDKTKKVTGVFDSVASRYDIMNDCLSFGIHRLWKRFTIEKSGVKPGDSVLDLAGGTGDLAMRFVKRTGDSGRVVLSDIDQSMLEVGRDRVLDCGLGKNINFVLANAEALPFKNNSFNCVTIAFGLRNVARKEKALESVFQVLKPGGRLLVLEFTKPVIPGLDKIYDFYSFNIIPEIGKLVTGDSDSYKYLSESIRKHPDQNTLKEMMQQAGFERCDYFNLSGGITALHRGFKL